jgi:adenylate kinase
MCGITGTPGTGKSMVAEELAHHGHVVVHLVDTVRDYVIAMDEERDTQVVDVERWAAAFHPVGGFVEGHLAHFLPCDRIVVLRCRPDILRKRLLQRKYRDAKIAENVEAEALDACLIEASERFDPSQILELDTTGKKATFCARQIERFCNGEIPPSFGSIDWSEYLGVER